MSAVSSPGRNASRMHFFTIRDRCFAYDVQTTYSFEIDRMALSILPELLAGNGDRVDRQFAGAYTASELRRCVDQCKRLLAVIDGQRQPGEYRHPLLEDVTGACLHVAHGCNLRCEYCYASFGTFGGSSQLMEPAVMRKAIDFVFRNAGDSKNVQIGFFGGEPLLNFDGIREGVSYARAQAAKHGKEVSFSLTSNATLLSPAIMEFLSNEDFSLIFSLDGPASSHDRMRRSASGAGTHDVVLERVKQYAKRRPSGFTVRGTVTSATPNLVEQVLFLNAQGFTSVAVEPAQLADDNPYSISTPAELLRIKVEYDRLADIYLERLFAGRPISFFHFDSFLLRLLRPRPNHTECGAGGGFIAIAPDGKVFPCFEAVVEKQNCIGDIDEGFVPEKRAVFQSLHADSKEACRDCWLKYCCGGGCHALNVRYNGDVNSPYRPQCELIEHRLKLAVWMLATIRARGQRAVERLKRHLHIANTANCETTGRTRIADEGNSGG